MVDGYASHLPVLRELATRIEMRRVVEFGGGEYSTKFFLGLADLERLVTVETDPAWAERIRNGDRRHTVTRRRQLGQADFCMIDDGQHYGERLTTIHWVLGRTHPPTLIHDAELPEYREAIEEEADGVIEYFMAARPWSAVVWT